MENKTRVLVVDDDPHLRELLKALFEDDHYEVLEAADAATGLDSATQNIPHLIIVDVLMPRLSGLDFIAGIRTNPAARHVPILVYSAKHPPDDRRCLELGANAYLTKPVDLQVLRRKAKELLGHPS